MAKKKQGLKVVKVPLDYFPNQYSVNFPPMPIMYLELLENKDKVKKELRNKDYIPPEERIMEHSIPTTEQAENQNMIEIDKDFEIKDYSSEYPDVKFPSDGKQKRREPIKILDLSDPKPIQENKQEIERFEEIKMPNTQSTDDAIREKLNQRFENIKNEYNKSKSTISIDDDDDIGLVKQREPSPRHYEKNERNYDNDDRDDMDDREDRRRDDREDRRRDDREDRRRDDREDKRRDDREDKRRDDREDKRRDDREDKRRDDREDRRRDDREDRRRDDREDEEQRDYREERRRDDREEREDDEQREDRDERKYDNRRDNREEREESRHDERYYTDDREEREERRNDDREDRNEGGKTDTQNKIMNLLFEDDKAEPYKQNNQSYQNIQNNQNQQRRPENMLPPKLSEINNGIVRDVKGVRDITKGLTKQEEEEDMEKRILLDKFAILKKKYKDAKIPDFNLYTDLGTLKKTYESTVRNLQLDATVDNYKRYLMIGFGLTQYLITKFTKIDMTGFAEQQILAINQYERILIEIGEKSYFTTNTSPPELRLLLLMGFNAVIFVMSKMMFSPSNGIASAMNTAAKPQEQKPKSHMRGPNLDDLKEFENLAKKAKNE